MYRGAWYYTWELTWVYGDVKRYIVRYRGAWYYTWTCGDV